MAILIGVVQNTCTMHINDECTDDYACSILYIILSGVGVAIFEGARAQ